MFFLLLLPIVYAQNTPITCEITVSIGAWLKNNTGTCTHVKGHFILTQDADKYTRKLFSAFSELKEIEGCIYVRDYSGSKNLSFFNKLETVICNETDALLFDLINVIDVVEPNLKTMGFNSLKTVEGPGQIVLFFEDPPEPYYDQRRKDGIHCFSKKEQIFLAYHPQFRRTMYQTCEVDDPCFRLDHWKWWYSVFDIPPNCTVFVGPICLWGPFELEMVADRFQNLTLLIGQLHVMGTLLDSIDTIFPNLNNIYPFERSITTRRERYRSCSDYTATYFLDATQYIHVYLNRFLTNISLPSLQPLRPIDVSKNNDVGPNFEYLINDQSFLPDTITDQCAFYPNFTCGSYVYPIEYEQYIEIPVWIEETWIISMVAVAIGVAFSIRSIVLLQFSHASRGLPYTRWLIIIVILISTLVALESCIFYQKTYRTLTSTFGYYQFPEFKSTHLFYQPIQFALALIAACKHVCLVIIILCYIDIIIFYRRSNSIWINSHRISLYYCSIVMAAALGLVVYLNSQLTVIIRGRRPNYSYDKAITFIPFVMNVDYAKNFTKFVPSGKYLDYFNGALSFTSDTYIGTSLRLDEVPLDTFGMALPTFSTICDVLMIITVILFYFLTSRNTTIPRHNFVILIILYLQLSMNRIRYLIYDEILLTDFCLRIDYDKMAHVYAKITCFNEYLYTNTIKWETITDIPFMEKYQWDILEKLLEKLPYICYPIVSIYCYLFARYHHYYGEVVYHRETKKDREPSLHNPSSFREETKL